MERRVTAFVTLVAGLLVLAFAAPAGAENTRTLPTTLTGGEEVSSTGTLGAGDLDAAGFARITVRGSTVCWLIQVAGIEQPATAAHIHAQVAGQNGPIVVPLTPPVAGSSFGCTAVERALARNIREHPTQYYVNVHNGPFPGGAVRGQLGGKKPRVTQLVGAEEVPPADPDGVGWAVVTIPNRTTVCFELAVTGIDPSTAAHIHFAPRGVNGPVVVPLTAPSTGSSSGCVAGVDAALARAIREHPAQYYVNVHNTPFPDGAIRGQLVRARNF